MEKQIAVLIDGDNISAKYANILNRRQWSMEMCGFSDCMGL